MKGFESLTLKSGDSLVSEKLTKVNAPIKISHELSNDVLRSEYSFSFAGNSPTKITSHYKITGNDIFWQSIRFLSKPYMRGAVQTN
jgi:hypothetical protein